MCGKVKVVIAGAGPAGIVAAYELQKTQENRDKFDVIILEETDDIGGIQKTKNIDGNRMDMGGHRFFSKDSRVLEWWFNILPLQEKPSVDDKELGRQVLAEVKKHGALDPETTDDVMLLRNRVSRIYFKGKFFDYPVTLNSRTIKNMGFMTTIHCGLGYISSRLRQRPEDSLENFYINRFGRPLYRMFFEGYTEKLWGRHPSEISADWGEQRVKGLSIAAVIKDVIRKKLHIGREEIETSLIETFYYPKHGPGKMWETALSKAIENGVKLEKNTKLVGVALENDRVTSVDTKRADGTGYTIECDWLLQSVPIKDLFEYLPDKIDAPEYKYATGLPYRDFMTCGILVDRLSVQNETDIATYNNNIPDCWVYVQDSKVKLGRVQIFNNWQPYMVKDHRNKVWIGTEYFCSEGDTLWEMQDTEFKSLAIRELKEIGLISENTRIEMTHVERVKKAYPAYFDTYKNINDIQSRLNSINGLLCIGRNGQHRYNNMDHSMITAFKAVDILAGKAGVTKNDLWNVNTEKQYHEQTSVTKEHRKVGD